MHKLRITADGVDKIDRGFSPVLDTAEESARIIGWAKTASNALRVLDGHFGPDHAHGLGAEKSREFWPLSARAAREFGLRKYFVGRVWEPSAEVEADPVVEDTA
jgi:hypothetical protein